MERGAARLFFCFPVFCCRFKIANYDGSRPGSDRRNMDKEKKEEKFLPGFPPVPGWYLCQLDGGQIRLFAKKCELTGKWRWYDETGEPVTEAVSWRA